MDYLDKFSELLERAKGNRTLRQFEEDTGVSRTYLNNYINKKYSTPPGIEQLQKIATSCKNGVNYEDLLIACKYIQDKKFVPQNIYLIKGRLSFSELSAAIAGKVDIRLISTLTGEMLKDYAQGSDIPTDSEVQLLAFYVDVDPEFFYRENKPKDLQKAQAIYKSKKEYIKKSCKNCECMNLIDEIESAGIDIKNLVSVLEVKENANQFNYLIELMKSRIKD